MVPLLFTMDINDTIAFSQLTLMVHYIFTTDINDNIAFPQLILMVPLHFDN